jgi:flagellar biosynthesis/type III secretory pathway chaperone
MSESQVLQKTTLVELDHLTQQKDQLFHSINALTQNLNASYPNLFFAKQPLASHTHTEQELVHSIEKLTNECFELNKKNGMILVSLENMNTGLIHHLFQNQDHPNLYSATGKTRSNDIKKNLGKA